MPYFSFGLLSMSNERAAMETNGELINSTITANRVRKMPLGIVSAFTFILLHVVSPLFDLFFWPLKRMYFLFSPCVGGFK